MALPTTRKKETSITEVTIKQALESQKDSVTSDVYSQATREYDALVKNCQLYEKDLRFQAEVKRIKDQTRDSNSSSQNAPHGDKWPNLYMFLKTLERRLDYPTNIALWRKYTYMTSLKEFFDQIDPSKYENSHSSAVNSREPSRVKEKDKGVTKSQDENHYNGYKSQGYSGIHSNVKRNSLTNSLENRSRDSPNNHQSNGASHHGNSKKATVENGTHSNNIPNRKMDTKVDPLDDTLKGKERQLSKKNREIASIKRTKNRPASEHNRRNNIPDDQLTIHTSNSFTTDTDDSEAATQLGEYFESLNEDEWSEAFEAMKKEKRNEGEILQILFDVVMGTYDFCLQISRSKQQQLESSMLETLTSVESVTVKTDAAGANNLKALITKTTKDLLKSTVHSLMPAICKAYRQKSDTYKKLTKEKKVDARVDKYIDKCLFLTWQMCVQDPPMCLCAPKVGGVFHTDAFTYYEKNGTKVKICVWPALYRCDGGPLVRKGSVNPK